MISLNGYPASRGNNRFCCSVAVRELREASGRAERSYNQAGRRLKASVLGGCLRGCLAPRGILSSYTGFASNPEVSQASQLICHPI